MYTHEYTIRIRYAHTDQMGVVYHGNYASFYEISRVESIRDLGFSYKELEGQGIIMPVLECYSKFIRPAYYDELITIRSTVKEKPGTRIRYDHELFNEAGTLINVGYTVLVFLDKTNMKPCGLPPVLEEAFAQFFEAHA